MFNGQCMNALQTFLISLCLTPFGVTATDAVSHLQISLLLSKDLETSKLGAQSIYYSDNPSVESLDTVAELLLNATSTGKSAKEVDVIAWYAKTLSNKNTGRYDATLRSISQKAHDKKLQPSDWEGSTFTISNLGMFGIEEFTAIINPPDACILAVGGIKETAVVKNGQLVPGNVMKVTMSCDHRAVDGAVGSAFLKTLKGLLEDPVRILI